MGTTQTSIATKLKLDDRLYQASALASFANCSGDGRSPRTFATRMTLAICPFASAYQSWQNLAPQQSAPDNRTAAQLSIIVCGMRVICHHNAAHQPPRATRVQHETKRSSRGWLHVLDTPAYQDKLKLLNPQFVSKYIKPPSLPPQSQSQLTKTTEPALRGSQL